MARTACPAIIVSYFIGHCKNMALKVGHIYSNWPACLVGLASQPVCLVCARYKQSCFVGVDVLITNWH